MTEIDARFWLRTHDGPALFIAMARSLIGNARISFEGDLSRCKALCDLPGASADETDSLKRNTIAPRLGFVVLPLESSTITPILDQVLHSGVIANDVIHIQIEKDGELQFGAYDNFHAECVVSGPAVPITLLKDLREKHVLRSFESVPVAAEDG